MNMRVTHSRLVRTLAALVVLACIGAGAAYATGGFGSGGVLVACAKTNDGSLRLVTSSSDCRQQETAVQWNQQGPQGAQGPQGPAGPQGATGDAGPQGPAGPAGPAGADGKDGVNGTDGVNGKDGKDGVSVTSSALSTGNANCPTGGSSFTSASGTTYACNGATGPQGPQGPAGPSTVDARMYYSATYVPDANGLVGGGVACPSGEHATGGGYSMTGSWGANGVDGVHITYNGPTIDGGEASVSNGAWSKGWFVDADGAAGGNWGVTVYAMCVH
jgi:hypothetical protein